MSSLVSTFEGNTFALSDENGDIDAAPGRAIGLFSFDTRFLSKWILTIDGERATALAVDDVRYYETRFFLALSRTAPDGDPTLSVIRHREMGTGFRENLTVMNHSGESAEVTLRIEIDSDFADLFEVKNRLSKRGLIRRSSSGGRLELTYTRDAFTRSTVVSAGHGGKADDHGITFVVAIPPHGEWSSTLDATTVTDPRGAGRPRGPARARKPGLDRAKELDSWVRGAPTLFTDDERLLATYRRSLLDLAALRFSSRADPDHLLLAAGLPWYMTGVGRDSILTSLQTLPFVPDLAAATLTALGKWQGCREDDFREEEPGRIPHEQRFGELTAFEERPYSPYYGSADATPLYVILLDEYERWTGDADLVKTLEQEARAALHWIDDFADLQGNGYVSYRRRNQRCGVENQCWKDSWDSISYHDGAFPGFPRATCELQGYAYDAKRRAARLARTVWLDPGLADRLDREADDLKKRFNGDFWLDDPHYFALALDVDGRRVDALTSNLGHLLWSGIVDDDRAEAVAEHLMSDRLFSGWGIRTMATSEARYNPLGFHVGAVWPFDNSIIAWGLRRYGFADEAARVAEGILDAAAYFDGRLPEAIAGYGRNSTVLPVRHPSACAPQAWSTGAPLLLLRVILGLEPIGDQLVVEPAVPASIPRLELLGVQGPWGSVDAFARGRIPV